MAAVTQMYRMSDPLARRPPGSLAEATRERQAGSQTSRSSAKRAFSWMYWNRSSGFLPIRQSRSEEHTSELQSLMRISYAVFCLKKKTTHTHVTICKLNTTHNYTNQQQPSQL